MYDKIVVVGFKAKQFLKNLSSYMEKEEKIVEKTAVEVPFKGSLDLLSNEKNALNAAEDIIALIPIKLFPALRYNVDECWEGVETWDSAERYQEKIRNLVSKSAKIRWVLTGIEGMSVTNNFLDRSENGIIKNPPGNFDAEALDTAVQGVVERFLREIDEMEFGKGHPREKYVLCFDKTEAGKYQIGEKAVEFWMKAAYRGDAHV